MRFSKIIPLLGLATPIVGSPININENERDAVTAREMVKQATSDKPALVSRHEIDSVELEDAGPDNINQQDAQKLAFAENFFKALATFVRSDSEAEYVEGTEITTAPLILAINATINNILFPRVIALTNSTEPQIAARTPVGNPSAWELSGGRRGPPCPGWPAKQQYNATHWREWTFLHGYEYGPMNPKCPVSSGKP